MIYIRACFVACSALAVFSIADDAFAYKRAATAGFTASTSEHMAFRYDNIEKQAQFYRLETQADSISVGGVCYDMALMKQFSVDLTGPTTLMTVYDELGCEGHVFEKGVLSCGVAAADVAQPTSSGIPDDIIIDMTKGQGTGWATEARGSREALRYSGAADGECDTTNGQTFTFNVPQQQEYTIRAIMAGSCDNISDCTSDEGWLTVKPSGLCMSVDSGDPKEIKTESLAELWLFVSLDSAVLMPGDHTLTIYSAYQGTAVNALVLSPSKDGELLNNASLLTIASQAIVGCTFVDPFNLPSQ